MTAAEFKTFDVLGLPIASVTPKRAADIIHHWAKDETGRFVCLRDVHGVMRAQQSEDYFRIHHQSAMLCPDGMPLVFIGKRRGFDVERTSGMELFNQMMADSVKSELKHYFYGGANGVADELVDVVQRQYPGIRIVGHATPPFRPLTDAEVEALADEINAAGADVVWIGLPTPKQEELMSRLKNRVHATMCGVGAVYDFATGRVKRAPRWMQKAGLEWLHRLLSEPRRLWYRYLVLGPQFVWRMLTAPSGKFKPQQP